MMRLRQRRVRPRPGPQKRERRRGAAMLVVMLVLLMVTGLAAVAIHSTTMEMRASGHFRRSMQADYLAEAALVSSFALVDAVEPSAIRNAMNRQVAQGMIIDLRPFEPELATNKVNFRVVGNLNPANLHDDICNQAGTGSCTAASVEAGDTVVSVEQDALGGAGSTYSGSYLVDINDAHEDPRPIPGFEEGEMNYERWTFTSRARLRLRDESIADNLQDLHEVAAESRGYAAVGPITK